MRRKTNSKIKNINNEPQIRGISISKIALIVSIVSLSISFVSSIPTVLDFVDRAKSSSVRIVSSDVLPWIRTNASYSQQQYYEAISINSSREHNSTPRLASLLTTIQNDRDKSIQISKAIVKINSLQRLEEPHLYFVTGISDEKFIGYIINNNYGKTSKLDFKLKIPLGITELSNDKFKQYFGLDNKIHISSISSGEIKKAFEFNLSDELKELLIEESKSGLNIQILPTSFNSEISYNSKEKILLRYSYSEGFTVINSNGKGNVDSEEIKPKVLSLDIQNSSPPDKYEVDFKVPLLSKSSISLETIILPSESCKLDLTMYYIYNGKNELHSALTKDMSIPIYVPLYKITKDDETNKDIFDYLHENNIENYVFNSDEEFQSPLNYKNDSLEFILKSRPADW